ncbi:MAG: hypothetical protein KA040_00965 [Aliarcobacter sp.]|nr:hypothetical protein [Aliarcobacter sp.]
MSKYIPIKQIISLEINVSEKIDNENLKDFVLTSLSINNKIFSNKDLIYNSHIDKLNQYQMIVIDKNYKYVAFQIFELFYDKKVEGLDLYLCDDFFCLYKNGLFYYYQTIEFSLTIEDFLEFINRKFNTKINNYIKIEKDYLEELKNKYLSKNIKTTLKNINIKNDNSFKFYMIYVFILFILGMYFYLNTEELSFDKEIINNQNLEFERFKKEHNFLSSGDAFDEILENIKRHNLDLQILEYKQSKIKIILSSQIKENLYLFLQEYKKSLLSSSVYFDENKQKYEATAYVNLLK